MRISKRLLQIYELADGPDLWDIGCDHSLIARINSKQGKFSKVYCVDKSRASLDKILKVTKGLDFKRIELVCSDGCDLNWESVCGSVVIAGVGGNTLIKILNSCPEQVRNKITWVLNPFSSVEKFLKECLILFPGSRFESVSVIEKGRERIVFKFQKQLKIRSM